MAILPALDTAARALLLNEAALGVVGDNIANVNTPGYTRRTPSVEATASVIEGGVLVGTGARLASIDRVIDPLLLGRRLSTEADRGEHTALRDQLAGLAAIANDLVDPSLTSALGDFFDAADALARNPGAIAEREDVLGSARALATELGRRSRGIAELQRAVDDRFLAVATETNGQLQRIAELNREIAVVGVFGQQPNTLLDEREATLQTLAASLGVRSVTEADGSLTVTAANGTALVTGGLVVHGITTRPAGAGLDGLPLHEVGLTGPGGAFLDVPGAFAGELAGLAAARDGALVTAQTNLDTLALAIRDGVNAVQTDPAALDLDGGSTASSPIFAGTGAADLAVVLTDPRGIGAALSAEPGDNQNALRLADLRTAPQAALGSVPFSAFVAQELGRIGDDAARATDLARASELAAAQVTEQHLSISGVSLTEELTSLIKYQHAFGAAAQLVNVGNQVLDDLLRIL